MKKKSKLIIALIFILVFYLSTMIYFYVDYSNYLNSYNSQVYESMSTLQNLIHKVHTEDSLLYKTLLSGKIESSKMTSQIDNSNQANNSQNIIADLLKLKNNPQLTSNKIASTIDEYYYLETLRERIIELNSLNKLSSNNSLMPQISILLDKYESQINLIVSDINSQIKLNKKTNNEFIQNLKNNFIQKEIIMYLMLVLGLGVVLYFFRNNSQVIKKSQDILDRDCINILDFVKSKVNNGNFPTIKEIKIHLKISHPTLLLKLKTLENKNQISIKKKGRNKYVFLK